VVAWTRHALHPGLASTTPLPPLDTPGLVSALARHRLHPLLAWTVPGPASAPLAPASALNLRRALARTATLRQLGETLDAAGIPWLTVKGPVLAVQLWGAPERRHAGDLDIIVAPGNVRTADSLLLAAGCQRTDPDIDLTPRQWTSYLKIKYEMAYRHPRHPDLFIEIKWRLDGVPDLAERLARPHFVAVLGHPVPTLPLADNFRYLCRHGAKHVWFRLFWLVDVARLLAQSDVPWTEVLPAGRADPSYRSVAQACLLVRDFFGITPPPGLLPAPPASDAIVRQLAAEARAQLAESRSQFSSVGVWARQLRYRTRIEPGIAGLRQALLPHLFSPLNWKTLPLPDRWFWLYPLLSPLLWLKRVRDRKHPPSPTVAAPPPASPVPRSWFTPLVNLARRPPADWLLLAEAVATASLAKITLLTLPFARIAPRLGHAQAETLRTLDPAHTDLVRRIGWAVRTSGRYLPARIVCLPQAMAAQTMLRRRSLPSTLYLGVHLGENAAMTAHAWLRTGPLIVTGNEARRRHTTVMTFASI
jgi:hypothetical protein